MSIPPEDRISPEIRAWCAESAKAKGDEGWREKTVIAGSEVHLGLKRCYPDSRRQLLAEQPKRAGEAA